MYRGGVTNRVILGVLVDTERETKDVSGLIPDNIGEEYLKLLNDYHKLEEEHEKLNRKIYDGMEIVTEALSNQGIITTIDGTFESIVTDIEELSTVKYNKGYNSGVAAADARSNPSSTNYKAGYNAGVAAADGRALPGSVNYQSGYNAGHSAGYSQGVTDADNRANSNSANWQNGYATGVSQADGRALPGSVNYQSGYNAGGAAHQETIKAGYPGTNQGYALDFCWRPQSGGGARPTGSAFTSWGPVVTFAGYEFLTMTWGGIYTPNGWTCMYRWYF